MNKRIKRKKQKQLMQAYERKLKARNLYPPKLNIEIPIFPDYSLLALYKGHIVPPKPTLHIDHL